MGRFTLIEDSGGPASSGRYTLIDDAPPEVPTGAHGEIPGPKGEIVKPRFGDGLRGLFGGHNPIAETYDLAAGALDPRSPRDLGERVMDTVNFAASVPFRALRSPTLGDAAASLGYPGLKASEDRFVENNAPLLKGIEAAGTPALAMPLGQGFVRPAPSAFPTSTRMGGDIAEARAGAIAEDMAAFDRQGVRPFGPAFNQGPVASVAKQLTETPILGGPLKGALDESIFGTAGAVGRVADNLGAAETMDQAGRTLATGLERFRGARMSDLEPGSVQALGLPADVQGVPQQVMSAGARQVANQAAPIRAQLGADVTQTTRGQQFAAGRQVQTRQQFLSRRTNVEDLTDQQLQTVVRTPAQDTSFATRADALYERAWRQVPDLLRENGTANPNLVAPVNTRVALGQIDVQIANDISGQSTLGGALVERLRNPQANITLGDMRAIRTEVGRALGNTNPLQQTLSRQQLGSLYAAISRDIEIGLETIANRTAMRTNLPSGAANRTTAEQARAAGAALRAFRTADRYFRSGMARMDRVDAILGTSKPEAAAQRLTNAALAGGRGDIGLISTVRGALRPEEWGDMASLVLRQLGEPVASARGTTHEAGFSVSSFMTRWQKMDPRARDALFDGPHRAAIDDLIRIASRLADVEATTNTSRSGTNAINLGGLLATGGSIVSGNLAPILGTALTGGSAAILMSRPAYARWMARYATLRARTHIHGVPVPSDMTRHIGALLAMTAHDPEAHAVAVSIAEDNGVISRH